MAEPTDRAGAAEVMGLLTAGWVAHAVTAAAVVGVADALAEQPLSIEELARRTGTRPEPLFRVLRALATVGLVRDTPGGMTLTPTGAWLRADVPGSLRPFAVMMGSPEIQRSWSGLEHTLRTGDTAFDAAFGRRLFEYYAENPAAARIGAAGLTSRSTMENDAVVAAFSFPERGRVVDVGGGEGTLLRTVLRAHPDLTGLLLELPHVVRLARAALANAPEASRVELVEGDFSTAVPSGGDVYLVKKVLHDWDDDAATEILVSCRAAMGPGSRLLVVENLVLPGDEPGLAKLLDLLMLVYAGGRERTEPEFRALLAAAGLRLVSVLPTAAGISMLEAVPA
jgi:O-methyltransferase domain